MQFPSEPIEIHMLPSIISELDVIYSEALANLKIPENGIVNANRTHASWQIMYDEIRVQLFGLTKQMEARVAQARSKLYVSYTQNHDRDLTEAGKKTYIDGEPAYLAMNGIAIEIKVQYERFQAVCTAYKSRGYAINNLTKLAIASIEDVNY